MTSTFRGVELARTGRFDASTGPVTLTTQDFDNMVEAYNSLKGKVDIPVKLGHDEEQPALQESGLPAAGWVENLRRVGQTLVADLVRVPDPVAELIRSGALRKRSIEAIRNVNLAGKRWKFALTGLALLGAELPAVDSLEDIAALYASGRVAAAKDVDDPESTIVVFQMSGKVAAEDQPVDELLDELKKVIDKIAATTAGKKGAPKLRQLFQVASDELKRVQSPPIRAGQNTQEDDMDIGKLRTMLSLPETATEEEVLAALEAKLNPSDDNKADENANDKTEATRLSRELADTQKRVIALEEERARHEVTTKVDEAIKAGKFMPSSRESLIKLAMHDVASFDEMAKTTPSNSVLKPERGTTTNEGGIPEEVEPTESELKAASAIGLTRDDLIKQKARDLNIQLPEPKKEEGQKTA